MLRFWPPIKKNDKSEPMFREICSFDPQHKGNMLFDPLSLQKVAIMAPFSGHVACSQQFWDERGQNCQFFNRGPKSQHCET